MALTHHTATENHVLNSWSRTEVKFTKLRHIWTIQEFSFCHEAAGKCLESSVFGAAGGPKWVLLLYPNGYKEAEKDYVALFLEINSKDIGKGYPEVKYRISLLKSNEKDILYQISNNDFYHWKTSSWKQQHGYQTFMKRVELIKLLDNDQLVICCEIAIPRAKICSSNSNNIVVPQCSLSNDLGSMLSNQRFGNTTVQVDDKEFVVCRQILQARSSVFAAMFDHEMEEKNQKKIIIKDFEPSVVEEMLMYIYTGKSPNLQDMANDLLLLADKYDLGRLKIMCEEVLSRKLAKENAIEILILADLCGADELKTRVINFIATNGSYFLEGLVWENAISSMSKHQNLIVEVTRALCAFNIK